MRILIQLCQRAQVSVDGKVVSQIGPGEVLFVGFEPGDDERTIVSMIEKLLKLRIFADGQGKTNLSLSDKGGEILAVSQFTLYADVRKGNRPSFVRALGSKESRPLYERFETILREHYPHCGFGIFGAEMKVELVNDGPFTLWLDSEEVLG